jgi:Zn-dependent protease/predicted transcriptional regulator
MERVMFSNSVKILSLSGFDIKVDPSWLVIASLVTWSLSHQYFPDTVPNAAPATYLMMALIGMLGLFISLLLHELAHSVVARCLGIEIKSITLFIFGGLAELGTEPKSARDEFWIAVAGPALSLCLAFCFWVFAQTALLSLGADTLVAVLSYLALINLVLALFNLVPAFPLDGGRMLRAYLWHRSGDALKATQIAAHSGTVFAYFLMALGVLALFQGAFVSGLWYLLIGGFVLMAARSAFTSKLAQTVLADKVVSDLMTLSPVTVAPEMTLSEFVNQIMLRHSVSFVPVMDGDVLLGHIDQAVLSRIDRENWGNARVGDVFVGLDTAAIVAPDMAVPDLLDQISKTGHRKYMVVRDHQLLGVVTLADLTRYLGLATLAYPSTSLSR